MVNKAKQTKSLTGATTRRGVSAKRYLPTESASFSRPNIGGAQPAAEVTTARQVDAGALREQIEKKAYELFEQRGCSHGDDLKDWFEAEKLINI